MLDLLSPSAFPDALDRILSPVATVPAAARHKPEGFATPRESDLRSFCRSCAPVGVDLSALQNWWVSEEYKGPTWDLLSECLVGERPGFLLVEAKAHESELNREGKKQAGDASPQSAANHQAIVDALRLSEDWFQANVHRTCRISVQSHYQLANRLSAAHALASCGIPVVLLYLGFVGDKYFHDYIRDGGHWHRLMGAYLDGSVPLWWPGATTSCGGGSITMLVRVLPIQTCSEA